MSHRPLYRIALLIIILAGIVVVVIGTIVLITVPVRHVEAVARDFTWRRRVDIGTRVWVKRKSKRQPKSSPDIRNVETRNADDPDKLHYTYEERVWRNMRSVLASGRGQANVRDPVYVLGRDEEVRGRSKSYEAKFVSKDGRRYSAKIQFTQWKVLTVRRAQSTNWAATCLGAYGQSSLPNVQLTGVPSIIREMNYRPSSRGRGLDILI